MGPPSLLLRSMVAACILLPSVESIAAQTPRSKDITRLERVEGQLFEHVNAERVREGLTPLLAEPMLIEIAGDHTVDMLRREFFAHENLDGDGPAERVGRKHRTFVGSVSENIWTRIRREETDSAVLAAEVMYGLMNSPGHRKNILTPELTHMGIGVYSSSGPDGLKKKVMVTQLFGAIRGYTEKPVPESLLRHQTVRFGLLKLDGGGPVAHYYDLWSVEEARPVIRPTRIDLSKMEVPSGTYRLRFLFDSPIRGQLEAVSAPYVTIR